MLQLLQYRAWALAEAYYSRVYPVLAERLHLGHSLEGLVKKQTEADLLSRIDALIYRRAAQSDVEIKIGRDEQSDLRIAKIGDKNIALIPVIGPLTKYGGLCSYGMQHYQGMINRANASANIAGIVLIMDTPGGTVDGTPEFGLTVRHSQKPVGVFGDSMVASAGLWIASQAVTIVGNKNNPTEFGSIGVLMVLPNHQNEIAAGRLPQMEIFRAKQSTEKALVNSIEPITDEGRKEIIAELTELADTFIATVKDGRGEKLNTETEGLFAGRMFDSKTSKKIGLIDEVGTLHTAVKRVADVAREREKINVSTQSKADTMKFPKISALLGAAWAKVFGKETEAANLTTEEQASLEAAEQKVAKMEEENARLQATIEENNKKIASLNAQVAELNTQISTLNSEKQSLQEQLDKKPTGYATTIIPGEKTETQQATDPKEAAKSYQTSVDEEVARIKTRNSQLVQE
jgi:protease-4